MTSSERQSPAAGPTQRETGPARPQTVWVVREASPGHDSQSRGLAAAMGELRPLRCVEVIGRERIRGWMRPWIKRWMGSTGRPLPERVLRRIADVSIPDDAPPPDLLLASGGKSVFTARTLATRHHAALVYIGEQNRFPDPWFDIIVSPVPGDDRPNVIQTELIPTTVTPQEVEAAAAKAARPAGRLWAMVIGGRSRSHRFTETDWRDLAHGMNTLADRENIGWLLTTSRRTGTDVEAILQKELHPDTLADAIWWSQAPRRELHAFLGLAEIAFVTQDSVTMVTEAIAAGRPTVALRPADTRLPRDSFLPIYFHRLEQHGRLLRVTIEALNSFRPSTANFSPIDATVMSDLAARLAARLQFTDEGAAP